MEGMAWPSWDASLWQIVRLYAAMRSNAKNKKKLEENAQEYCRGLGVDLSDDDAAMFVRYLEFRKNRLQELEAALRTEEEAKALCRKCNVTWKETRTKNKDHHQSSQTMVAAVNHFAGQVCGDKVKCNPGARCQWIIDNSLHVSARNLDGAAPSIYNPRVIWEIKEYWGKTGGGSKMSDALYECELVGKDLREFEQTTRCNRIFHVVFLDGKTQWNKRKSDLARFVDLEARGLIDKLIVGREVETLWAPLLREKSINDGEER